MKVFFCVFFCLMVIKKEKITTYKMNISGPYWGLFSFFYFSWFPRSASILSIFESVWFFLSFFLFFIFFFLLVQVTIHTRVCPWLPQSHIQAIDLDEIPHIRLNGSLH